MKKILLSLLMLIGVVVLAKAETFTYNMKTQHGASTISPLGAWTTADGITFTPDKGKGTGSTAPAYNKAGDVRLYKGNTLKVSTTSYNITSISFTISSQGLKRYAKLEASEGSFVELGANPLVWNGNTQEVTFTVGDNTFGTETGAGQFDFDEVSVTVEAMSADYVAAPVFSPAATILSYGQQVTISCATEGAEIYYTTDGTDPTKSSTKYTAPIDVEEYASFAAIAYKGENSSEVTYKEYMPCPIIESLTQLSDLKDYYDTVGDVPFGMAMNLTVVYHSGKYTYVAGGYQQYALIFDNSSTVNFAAGTQIMAGWTGKLTKYNGLTELVPDTPSALEADGTAAVPNPTEMEAGMAGNVVSYPNAYEAMYVKFMGVTFADATPSNNALFKGKMGEGEDEIEVTFYNRFGYESVEAGKYDVTGFVAIYNGNAQIYVTEMAAATVAEPTYVYAVGAFQGWDPANPLVFTYDEGANYYTLSIDATISSLKLSTQKGSWDDFNAGAFTPSEALANGTWTEFQAGSSDIMLPWSGVYTIYVNLDSEMMKVYTETPEPEEGGVYAVGDFQGWNPASPTVLTYDETEGCYVLSFESDEEGVDPIEISSLKLSTAKGTWDEFNAAAFVPAVALQNGVWTGYVAGDGNIELPWKGVYTIYVNLELQMMKVYTETPEPTEPEYVDLYLRGSMNSWGANDAWKFETTDGVEYTLDNVTIAATDEFKVADANWSNDYDFGGVQNIEFNTEYTMVPKGSNCTLKDNFTGNIVFNLDTMTIEFEMEVVGINDIETEAEDAVEYYNLQGVKLMNPTPGTIVIRIQGGKATKVIM